MRIAFYAPFKPLGHHHPSGDLVIATGLYDYFVANGYDIRLAGSLRARWIYWRPWTWIRLLKVYRQSCRQVLHGQVNLWLTYHTYYKAPDLLGPMVSRAANIPYVIFGPDTPVTKVAEYAAQFSKELKKMECDNAKN